MFDYLVYLVYRAGFALISLFPLSLLFAMGRALGFCAWLLLPKYRQLAFRNIDIAFGKEKSPREIRRIVRRHFQRLGANLLCGLKLASIPLEKVRERVTGEKAETPGSGPRGGPAVGVGFSHNGH